MTLIRKPLLFFTLILLGLSCNESEIKPKLSVPELTAIQLRKAGYIAEYLKDKDILLISSPLNLHDMSLKLNEIYDLMGYPEHKFIIDDKSPNARVQDVECYQSGIFYESGGATCVNYLCIGDSSFSILWDYTCFDGTCYSVSTSCWE